MSLMRASSVVKCQSMVVAASLRAAAQAATSRSIMARSSRRRFRHCRARMFNAISAMFNSAIDFEKRINDIYQPCRRPEDIEAAFQQLRMELDSEISEQMTRTRQQLLEHFDDEVREKLRMQQEASRAALDKHERTLMALTRHELDGEARFLDESSFLLTRPPFGLGIEPGRYELPRRSEDAHVYRLTHPLAEAVVARAKARELAPATVRFSLSEHAGLDK